MSYWRFYFPDDGERPEDSTSAPVNIENAEDAALFACEFDFRFRDGWDRGQSAFEVVTISTEGREQRWTCHHDHEIIHRALEIEAGHGPR